MKTYNELKEDFEKSVEKLQQECRHEDLSDWIGEEWAPLHSTGWQIKMCNICNKAIKRKIRCSKCGNWLIEGEDAIKQIMNSSYCSKCAIGAEKEIKEVMQLWKKAYGRLDRNILNKIFNM